MKSKHVAVIGAGITGLTAAYRLSELGHNVEVFEASNRVGGSIKTESFGAARVDIGPSGVLASRQSVVDLVRDLGLDSEWLSASPTSNRRYIFYKGKLNEVPTSPPKLLTSSWIPLSAKWRFVTEFFDANDGHLSQKVFTRSSTADSARSSRTSWSTRWSPAFTQPRKES